MTYETPDEFASDTIIENIACQHAGHESWEAELLGVTEEVLDTMDDAGNWATETWTVFSVVDLEGQASIVHAPGSLRGLIVQYVLGNTTIPVKDLAAA